MGALIMFALVCIIALGSLVYFKIHDKKHARENGK
jgi:hypothetical protein